MIVCKVESGEGSGKITDTICGTPKEAACFVLSVLLYQSSFQPTKTIIENFIEAIALITEIVDIEKQKHLPPNEKSQLTRIVTKLHKVKELLDKVKTKELVVELLFNTVLSMEGMSRLNGFGLCNHFGDPVKGNPERISLTRR